MWMLFSSVVLCGMCYGPGDCFNMLICMLNDVLDMSRSVLLSQYVGAFYLYGRCVCLVLIGIFRVGVILATLFHTCPAVYCNMLQYLP
jgi:hypothetical protein